MSESIFKSVEFKLYLSKEQEKTLTSWLKQCCWVYNKCLEHRKKSWKRRRESVSNFDQTAMLTQWRSVISWLTCPASFQRSAIQRVDKAFKAFFRRVNSNLAEKGYPRFKSSKRYHSMEYGQPSTYAAANTVRVPGLGKVKARGAFERVQGKQKSLRVIRRASGWYAQVTCQQAKLITPCANSEVVGIDLGLSAFLTTSEGEKVENPRYLSRSSNKLKSAQRSLSRKQKGSNRRKKAIQRVAKLHERVARQRRGFCHRISRDLVNRFGRIAIEDLQVQRMARGRFAKAINDVAWSLFTFYLTYKAENAGGEVVRVDPRGTSQTCPGCGHAKKKELSERQHQCSRCHLNLDRDHAAALVVRNRAFRPGRRGTSDEGLALCSSDEA